MNTPITPKEANLLDYVPISSGYKPKTEYDMLQRAVDQLGDIDYCIVDDGITLTIGRKRAEVDILLEQ